MMNLNQQIAKIDGWEDATEFKAASGPPEYWKKGNLIIADDQLPDYCAPENRHELERIAENVCLTYRHIWNDGHRYVLFAHGLTVGEGHSDKQSYALAKAIVEAKG